MHEHLKNKLMKKILLMMLLVGFAFGATAQDGRTIKQRKTSKEIYEQVTKARDYVPGNQSYKQQLDSVSYGDAWFLNCYKYEMDWKGRVKSEILYEEFNYGKTPEAVEKSVYDYEICEALPNLTGYYWQNGEWVEGWTEVYTFDENGDAVLWQQWDKQSTGDSIWWNVTYYNEMTYDENYNMLTEISYMYDFWSGNGDYIFGGKQVYEYDENNFVSATESWYFDSYETNDWVLSSRTEYVRMENGDYSEYTSYSYWTGEPVMDSRILKEFNEQGAIEVYHHYGYESEIGEVETQRYTATFLEDGLTISEYLVEDYWQNGVLEPYLKVVYGYDGNGNCEAMTNYIWNDSVSVWEESEVYTWEYDNTIAADEVLGHDFVWRKYGSSSLSSPLEELALVYNQWKKYSYSETICEAFYIDWNPVQVNEIVQERLNVNGLEGIIRYEGETAANISVFDMTGRCVATRTKVVSCDIKLNAGVYVVRVGNRAAKVVVR